MLTYSIIICTHNPDPRIIGRCLVAVSKLIYREEVEVIIVDNNSTTSVVENVTILTYLNQLKSYLYIRETNLGLTFARIAGARAASGDILIFFDDDNEPDPMYLNELKILSSRYPEVGMWGPGQVAVDFLDGVEESMKIYLKPLFQERRQEFVEFALLRSWQNCYPFGTGLCVKRSILLDYALHFEQKRFTLTDRAGNSLSSGGDTQLVLFGIAQGYAAGTSPTLKVNHMIASKKLQTQYLKRLILGTGKCYYQCHSEVFPEYLPTIKTYVWNDKEIINKITRRYIKLKLKPNLQKELSVLKEVAHLISRYDVLEKELPRRISWIYKDAIK